MIYTGLILFSSYGSGISYATSFWPSVCATSGGQQHFVSIREQAWLRLQ